MIDSITGSSDPIVSVLMAQLPIGVVIASRDGTVELVNDAARALLHEHQRAHAAPEPWLARAACASDDTFEPIHWIIARVLLTGEVVHDEEIQYLGPTDEWRTLSVRATPIADVHGEICQALVTFADVTDVKRAREWQPLIRAITRL